MAESDKLIIVLSVMAQTAKGNSHTVFEHTVEPGLGAVFFFEIMKKLLGCGWKPQYLRQSLEFTPNIFYFFDIRSIPEAHEHSGHMPVICGYADTLGRYRQRNSRYYDATNDLTPDL
jgi:hypothetical protein